jgi:hypothetical protein
LGLSRLVYRRITDLASTSGSGSRDVFDENMDTPESFEDDDDSESDRFESLPPSPNAEGFSWFNGKLVDNCLIINAIDFLFGS